MTATYEVTDRYAALGISYPDAATVCQGFCEGTGVYPTHRDDATPDELEAWTHAHEDAHRYSTMFKSMWKHREWWYWKSVLRDMLRGLPCDGYHVIECSDCGGSGKLVAVN